MKAIVTAPALIIVPGVVLRLTPEDAKLRKSCMAPLGGGLFRATLENHYKNGQVVEFADDTIPKMYAGSVSPVDEHGKVLLPQPPTPTPPKSAPAVADDAELGHKAAEPLTTAERQDIDNMTKAELLDFAETRGVTVDAGWNKDKIITALKKKKAA